MDLFLFAEKMQNVGFLQYICHLLEEGKYDDRYKTG